jgi:ATP-binding cassette subfamily C protein
LRLRQRELTYSRTFNRLAIITVPALTGVAAIWLGVEDFAIRPAVLITVILIFARMTRPLVRLRQSAQQFVLSLPAFEAVEALQAELDADARPLPKATRPLPPGPIVLHDVSYRHQGGGGVFKAGLVLEPGTFLGVTGPSGGGKTTFGDLLAGILEPQAGQITVGGECLDETHLAAWRNVIAYVGQDPFLFHDTVRRNLTWGERSADDAQLWRTLDCAGAAVLVKGFEHGLDTIIGERGARLSGGECQRIAIARALLRPARLLVLDEATNALDVDGEAEILRRLAALHPRPTIVLIAHRTESLAYCDRIVAIIRGRPLSLETADSMTSKSSAPEGAEIWRNAV